MDATTATKQRRVGELATYFIELLLRMYIRLVNGGLVHPKHPRRYYKYALLDPLDQPFATFRYYYRTWGQKKKLKAFCAC